MAFGLHLFLKFDLCDGCAAGAKQPDIYNRLPLHLACISSAPVEVVAALLEAHADGEAAWDEIGMEVNVTGVGRREANRLLWQTASSRGLCQQCSC